jgi:hypothetical protein
MTFTAVIQILNKRDKDELNAIMKFGYYCSLTKLLKIKSVSIGNSHINSQFRAGEI